MEKSITNASNPGTLCSLKQKISETMKSIDDAGINDVTLIKTLKEAMKKVDNVVSTQVKDALTEKFGSDCQWSIEVDNYIIPTLAKGKRNDYKYIIKNISWKNGPSIHEVHYYIVEKFLYYLNSKEYDTRLYTRNIPGIEKRYSSRPIQPKKGSTNNILVTISEYKDETKKNKTPEYKHMYVKNPYFYCTFKPIPINGNEFEPIEINISKIMHKVNEKEMKQYLQLQVQNEKLRIPSIKSETQEGVLLQLQENLETIFYMRENTPEVREANKQLMKNLIITASESTPPPLVRPAEGDTDHTDEGEGLSGTDQTDVFDDASIPSEEPSASGGGLPPTPESIDHNYHDDAEPELVKDFEEESGQGAPDDEEPGEDPAEEAAETPEEEAAEEAQEGEGPEPASEEFSMGARGNTISDLIEFERHNPLVIHN